MKNVPSAATKPDIYSGSNTDSFLIKIPCVLNGTMFEKNSVWKMDAAKPFLFPALNANTFL